MGTQLSIFDLMNAIQLPRVEIYAKLQRPRYNPEIQFIFRCGETVRVLRDFSDLLPVEMTINDKHKRTVFENDWRMVMKTVKTIEMRRLKEERKRITNYET